MQVTTNQLQRMLIYYSLNYTILTIFSGVLKGLIPDLNFLDLSVLPYPAYHLPLQRKGDFNGYVPYYTYMLCFSNRDLKFSNYFNIKLFKKISPCYASLTLQVESQGVCSIRSPL